MPEVAHPQRALVFGDEIRHWLGQAIAARHLDPLIDMGLQDLGAAPGVIEMVVGVVPLLVFDEPLGGMEFAHVVIQRSGAHQIHIAANGADAFFGQAANHQGVLEGARRL